MRSVREWPLQQPMYRPMNRRSQSNILRRAAALPKVTGIGWRKALARCLMTIVAGVSSLMLAAQALKAQPAAASLQCFEVPTSLLFALRQYQRLVNDNVDARDVRSEIAALMGQMIRAQSPAESRHNIVPRGLPHDSPLWSAGATCTTRPADERIHCSLVYYDKLWLGAAAPGEPRQMVRIDGWLVQFDFSPMLGGQSLSLGSIVRLGASQLLIECAP